MRFAVRSKAVEALDRVAPMTSLRLRTRFGGSVEPEQEILPRIVPPGSVVVDVGAHKGTYAYSLAQIVGPVGKVHAFEPQLRLANYLQRAFRNDPRVEVHQVALSDVASTRMLAVPDYGEGLVLGHATLERSDLAGRHMEPVSTQRLDEIDLTPSYVKIDVEGHELAVLRGSVKTLAAARPTVQVEILRRGEGARDNSKAILELFAELEYEIAVVDAHSELAAFDADRLLDAEDPITEDRYAYNFVFMPIA